MATTEKARTTATGQEFFAGWETASQAWRDFMGFQVRATKTMMDQGVGFTRKAAEHFTHQMEEGLKLQQDAFKYGLNLMEDWKKTAFDTAEKAVHTEGR